jgi:hypothetical protein
MSRVQNLPEVTVAPSVDIPFSNALGLLGPIVLGVLGQQQRSSGLDASGLAKLLASQKDNVLAALPSEFSREVAQ